MVSKAVKGIGVVILVFVALAVIGLIAGPPERVTLEKVVFKVQSAVPVNVGEGLTLMEALEGDNMVTTRYTIDADKASVDFNASELDLQAQTAGYWCKEAGAFLKENNVLMAAIYDDKNGAEIGQSFYSMGDPGICD